jgi:hypothetical protein
VLSDNRRQQLRVRIDVRARLVCGLNAPLPTGLRPSSNLQTLSYPELDPVFIIQGAAQRHERLVSFGCSGRLLADLSTLGGIPPKVIRARAMGFRPSTKGSNAIELFAFDV